jgi:predicted CXXCH cytochrome family protein
MTPRKVLAYCILFLLCLLPSLAPSASSGCLECHTKFAQPKERLHGALGKGCETCHIAPKNDHAGRKGNVRLVKEIPSLCYGCHEKIKFQGTYVHAPAKSGKCISCHDPHKSAFDHLLSADSPLLCYACHDKKKFTKKNVHPVIIGRSCGCHKAHASDYPSLLSATTHEVCIGCHRSKQTGDHVVSLPGGKTHPLSGPMPRNPRKQITCAVCHDPHSSDYRKLFPRKRVCPICHKYY